MIRGLAILLAGALALMLAQPALAQDLGRAPTPTWVDDLPLPAPDPALTALAQGGVSYLLSDHQVRWAGDQRQTWRRTVVGVTDRAGLEAAATLSLDFDPATETLALTHLRILRDGVTLDLTAIVKAEVMRREQRLDEGIVDGLLTAWVQVPGLRVGDAVDYATLAVETPRLPGELRGVYSELEWDVPVDLSRSVVLWPADWPLVEGPVPERVARARGPGPDGTIRLEWQRVGHVPPPAEDLVPLAHDPAAVVRLSADADWGALSAALSPFYAPVQPLSPDWQARADAIAAAHPANPQARAIAALRLVQDEVRYVSLSMGDGGIFARPPATVTDTGFGDCKDKALLLVTLLHRLGVEAAVALTDLDAGHALPVELPMLGAFDHVIVRIRLDGATHWVDPTASHQGGGFADAAPPDTGWALPLTGPGQTALEPVPVDAKRAWSTDVTESYRFTWAGVVLDVASVYHGGAADSFRYRWATTPGAEITQDYLAYFAERYPGLQATADIVMLDDRDHNRLTMQESYFLPRAALADHGLDASFPLAAEDFAANLPDSLPGPRRLPMATGAPAIFRHTVRVTGAPVALDPPAPVQIDNPAFRYAFGTTTGPDGTLELRWVYQSTGADVPAPQVAALIEDRIAVYQTTWFTWDLRP